MNVLFHHDIAVAVLGSGSKGNTTYIGDGRQGVLIDCGLSTKQILARLEAVGLGDAPIDAILVTHEHSDHVGAARVLDKRLTKRDGAAPPFYMTAGTAEGLHPSCVPTNIVRVRPGDTIPLRRFTLEPYTVPHDTIDPVAWAVEIGGVRVGVVTDLGRATTLVRTKLASLDIAVVEFNHDLEMLADGPYPWHLKQRIRSAHGHLSNDQAAELLADAASVGRLEAVVLAHLSEENNAVDKALSAAHRALHRAQRPSIPVTVATQREPLPPIRRSVPLVESDPGHTRGRIASRRAPLLAAASPTDSVRQQALFADDSP